MDRVALTLLLCPVMSQMQKRKQKYSSLYFLSILMLACLSGCKTPSVANVSEFRDSSTLMSEVQFNKSKHFKPNDIKCIAIGKIEDFSESSEFKNLNKSSLVRSALYGALSPKNYIDIELARVDHISQKYPAELLRYIKCDAILSGKILKFKNSSLVAYSVTSVELEVMLTDENDNILWQGKHSANSHEGSVPLSPVSLVTGIFTATTNKEDEVALQMIDAAVRRIINTLPDRDELDISLSSFADEPESRTAIKTNVEILLSTDLLSKGDYEGALQKSKEEIAVRPKSKISLLNASRASLMLANNSAAIDFALAAAAIDEEDRLVMVALSQAYVKNKKLNLAEASLRKIAASGHALPVDWYHLGLLQVAQNNIYTGSKTLLNAGNLGLEKKDFNTAYKALKKLKELSKKYEKTTALYIELGKEVADILNNSTN